MQKMMACRQRTALIFSLTVLVAIWVSIFNTVAGELMPSPTSFGLGRNLLQTDNASESTRQSDNFARVDPLDDFKKYRGGYNITNKHYWSSTVFTGVYGYAIGVVWLLCGLVFGVFLLGSTLCCKNNRKIRKRPPCPYHKQCYQWHILLATVFTVLAIIGTGLVLGGNAKFHSKAKTVVGIIMDTANDASETIYNTTGAMKDVNVSLQSSNTSSQTSGFLDSTSQELDSQAADIQRQAKDNRHSINMGLKLVNILTILTISLNLIALLALPVLGVLKLRRTLYMFVTLCWSLTVLCWLFCGAYFCIEKFAGDTCAAFEDFQHNPYNNSLSSILPCGELLSAKSVLTDVGARVYNLVNEVNANISLVHGADFVQVCNPFSAPPDYHYQPDNCPPTTIKIGDIPQVLKTLTCSELENGNCLGGLNITSSDVQTVEAYTNSIQTLLNAYPGMESLLECQSVKDAFTKILQHHCKPLKRYAKTVWAALVFLSVVMVALVLTWTSKAHLEQRCHFANGFVKPHSATANVLEAGTAKPTEDHSNPNAVV